jgi:hypothetical protein
VHPATEFRIGRFYAQGLVPSPGYAVIRICQQKTNMLNVICKYTINDTGIGASAISTKGIRILHVELEEIARVGVFGFVPPCHGSGVVALSSEHCLMRVHVVAVPMEELTLEQVNIPSLSHIGR